MKELNRITEESKRTIISLAAEFKFAQELQELLQKLDEESTHVDESIREANKMLHVYKWLARAERKTARGDDALETLFHNLKEKLPEKMQALVNTMEKQLLVADSHLVKLASYRAGEMKLELEEIRKEENLLRSIEDKHERDDGAEALKLRLHREIKELKKTIDDLMKWIGANTTLVKAIEVWARGLEEKTK